MSKCVPRNTTFVNLISLSQIYIMANFKEIVNNNNNNTRLGLRL